MMAFVHPSLATMFCVSSCFCDFLFACVPTLMVLRCVAVSNSGVLKKEHLDFNDLRRACFLECQAPAYTAYAWGGENRPKSPP